MSSRISLAVVCGLVAFLGVSPASAQPDGVVLAVVQAANIDTQTGEKLLEKEAPVFSGDRIDTGPTGEAQIRFRDDTKLVVGPNSSLVIDAFVFADDGTARQITINAVRGAFRFFTGSSPKDAYSIITPTATIGVRGTEFDVSVEEEGTTRVANFEGVTRICPRVNGVTQSGGECVEATDPCTLSVIRPLEPEVVRYSNDDIEFRNRQLKYYFRYIRDQESLLRDFQVDLEQCQFAEADIRHGDSPLNPTPPPEPPPPIPMPGKPAEPVFSTPPPLPTPTIRDHDRPVYNHTR
jgi:hypothetical protein